MIYQGSKGCICFYDFNEKLIASAPLSKYKTMKNYTDIVDKVIIDGMRKNHNLDMQKFYYLNLLEKLSEIKKYKRTKEDEVQIGICILALIKLKVIDYDNHILICGKKKSKKKYNV